MAKKTTATKAEIPATSIGERIENYLNLKEKNILYITLGLTFVMGLLLFDTKISIGGDDSSYIQRAYNFVHKGEFPVFQGPGYPLVLALLMLIFGFNILVFKFFSLIFYTLQVWFLYKAFKRRTSSILLWFLIGFVALNDYMLYYSSQTWSEGFYLLIQSICVYITFRVSDLKSDEKSLMKFTRESWKLWLLFGFCFLYLSITKTVAILFIVAPVLYFILTRQKFHALLSIVSFALCKGVYELLMKVFVSTPDSNQFELIMRKEAYNPAAGYEDLGGLIVRMFSNMNTYFSMHFYRILHFTEMPVTSKIDDPKHYATALILTLILIFFTVLFLLRKNKALLLAGIFGLTVSFAVFIGIHASNKQDRLIIIAMPFLMLTLAGGFKELLKKVQLMQVFLYAFMIITLTISFFNTFDKIPANLKVLRKNLSGQPYYGYTPDWVNFFEMSKWCADNLPEGSVVMSRKSSMSFLVSGKDMFLGVHEVKFQTPDEWVKFFKDNKVTHIMDAELRVNPKKKTSMMSPDGRLVNIYINTMQRILYIVSQKYPGIFTPVHSIGQDERAYLYKINLP
jgi:hypothetical protein